MTDPWAPATTFIYFCSDLTPLFLDDIIHVFKNCFCQELIHSVKKIDNSTITLTISAADSEENQQGTETGC